MRTRRPVGVAVTAMLVLLSGVVLYVSYLGSLFGGCGIVRLKEAPSPDGSRLVVTYRKECGATVPYSTHAALVAAGLSSLTETAPPFLSVRGIQDIQATWIGQQTVRVGLIPGTNTFYKRDQSVGDIRIEYE